MYQLRSINQRIKNSLKSLKILYKKKNCMQEVEMALMQEPITQINKFSAEKLQNISHAFRISRQDSLQPHKQILKFDGKLHLDLKVDKLLFQIQQCKINLAQLLELHMPNSLNSIQIKQLKLSNLKPSNSDEQTKEEIIQSSEEIKQNKSQKQQKQATSMKMQKQNTKLEQKSDQKPKQQASFDVETISSLNHLRRGDSYQINALKLEQEQKSHREQRKQQFLKQIKENENENSQIWSNSIKQIDSRQQLQTLAQKHHQGKQIGKQLINQLHDENTSTISQSMISQSQLKNSSELQLLETIQKQLLNFKKTLMLRQAQLGMLIYITEAQHDQSFVTNYSEIYSALKQYVIPASKLSNTINVFILEEVFQIQHKFLQQYFKCIQQIKLKLQNYRQIQPQQKAYSLSNLTKESSKKKLQKVLKSVLKLKVINSKIITMAEIFPYACIKDLDDLFSFSKSHQRWQKLIQNDVINYKIYGEPQKVRKSFQSLKNNLNIINASMNILNQNKDLSVFDYKNWGKIFQSSSKIIKVALFKADALHEASVMISQPDGKLAKQIWNLPQNETLQNFISAVLPAINFSEKIYIPRILTEYFKNEGKQPLPKQCFIDHVTQYGNQLYQKAPYQKKIPCRINAKHRINRKYETKTKDQQQDQKRPESYSKMFFNTLGSMTKAVTSLNSYFKKEGQNSPTAILHIHGGGFISMSSFIHQTYTRNWAKQLEVPILSVDYGKAPEHPYPYGLRDCLQAYMWLRFTFRQIYETQVQKIIIVGDSAGGNLAAALTTLLIQWNLPKPDGLVLVYPALNLSFNNYTPSLLHALNDMILPHTFLKICLHAYIKDPNKDPETDSLLSPINTREQTLKRYPRTKIFVGGKDPFHDDCCKFVQKLNQANQGIADLTIFDEFPHGFLQFDMTTNPHQQARKAIKQVCNALKQVMQYEGK